MSEPAGAPPPPPSEAVAALLQPVLNALRRCGAPWATAEMLSLTIDANEELEIRVAMDVPSGVPGAQAADILQAVGSDGTCFTPSLQQELKRVGRGGLVARLESHAELLRVPSDASPPPMAPMPPTPPTPPPMPGADYFWTVMLMGAVVYLVFCIWQWAGLRFMASQLRPRRIEFDKLVDEDEELGMASKSAASAEALQTTTTIVCDQRSASSMEAGEKRALPNAHGSTQQSMNTAPDATRAAQAMGSSAKTPKEHPHQSAASPETADHPVHRSAARIEAREQPHQLAASSKAAERPSAERSSAASKAATATTEALPPTDKADIAVATAISALLLAGKIEQGAANWQDRALAGKSEETSATEGMDIHPSSSEVKAAFGGSEIQPPSDKPGSPSVKLEGKAVAGGMEIQPPTDKVGRARFSARFSSSAPGQSTPPRTPTLSNRASPGKSTKLVPPGTPQSMRREPQRDDYILPPPTTPQSMKQRMPPGTPQSIRREPQRMPITPQSTGRALIGTPEKRGSPSTPLSTGRRSAPRTPLRDEPASLVGNKGASDTPPSAAAGWVWPFNMLENILPSLEPEPEPEPVSSKARFRMRVQTEETTYRGSEVQSMLADPRRDEATLKAFFESEASRSSSKGLGAEDDSSLKLRAKLVVFQRKTPGLRGGLSSSPPPSSRDTRREGNVETWKRLFLEPRVYS